MNSPQSETQSTILLSPDQIRLLPTFKSLQSDKIFIIKTLAECLAVEDELKKIAVIGFDTESKPTFVKGEVSTGPHLIQLASDEKAYLFQVSDEVIQFLKPIFENHNQIKVGFGLKNDAHLFRKKGIQLNSIVELSKCFSSFGLKHPVGLKNAMALLFQVHFHKNKKISTSNWSKKILSSEQIHYAAADAYAPVLVFEELLRLGLLPQTISDPLFKLRIQPNPSKLSTDA